MPTPPAAVRRLMTALALTVGLACAGLVAPGCGGSAEVLVRGTDRAAGADGTLQMAPAGNGAEVSLTVAFLPPPDRLGAEFAQYVVWFTAPEGAPVLAGQLVYDVETRSGTLRATTPHTDVEVRVTAEPAGGIAAPGEAVVLLERIALAQ